MAKQAQNPRAAAVAVLVQVITQGQSISNLLPHGLKHLPLERRALAQELCYGTLRWLPRLEFLLDSLLDKPLKAKDVDVQVLALIGLYQLGFMQIPPHAAVSETVAVTGELKKPWAKGLINALLRRCQREQSVLQDKLEQDPVASSAHPAWLLELLQQDWPQDWQAIITANQQRPPMTLRVNRLHQSRDAYQQALLAEGLEASPSAHAPDALTLARPAMVEQLPGFAQGQVSVQDAAAQLATLLTDPQPGMRVLDACAAPGGKTGHLLESCPGIELVALDVDAGRLERVQQNLTRLGLAATLKAGDAAQPDGWWDGLPFDRILLDAPCSASGVIRRHPDIKLLRRADDIPQLAALQADILNTLWSLLKPGGMLVYATCSVLAAENHQQLARFLGTHPDAMEKRIEVQWGRAAPIGRQILPNQDGMDGFYYACIVKQP
ncbi:MAG: 16S rRNA (cytosine(967)-C(5))-methyltransferase RsmB [Thiohalomonadaceae bacterium]